MRKEHQEKLQNIKSLNEAIESAKSKKKEACVLLANNESNFNWLTAQKQTLTAENNKILTNIENLNNEKVTITCISDKKNPTSF